MGKKYTWGLVLSGGGARGFAHAGALKAIEEANIRPEVISGTSAGSIVGALYAAGYTPDQILGFFLKKKIRDFIRFTIIISIPFLSHQVHLFLRVYYIS